MTNPAVTGLQLLWTLTPAALLICTATMTGLILLGADWMFRRSRAPAKER